MKKLILLFFLTLPFIACFSQLDFSIGFKGTSSSAPSVKDYRFKDSYSLGFAMGGFHDYYNFDFSINYGFGGKHHVNQEKAQRKGTYGVRHFQTGFMFDAFYMNETILFGPQVDFSIYTYTLTAGNIFIKGEDYRKRANTVGIKPSITLGTRRFNTVYKITGGYKFNSSTLVKEQESYTEEVYDEENDEYNEYERWETIKKTEVLKSSGIDFYLSVIWIIE